MIVTGLVHRVNALVRRDGVGGALAVLVKHGRAALGIPDRKEREYRRQKAETDRAFDRALGLDTGGDQQLFTLSIDSPNAALGVAHTAIQPENFHRGMEFVDIELDQATFVDLGAGKGRALMIAAEYPFKAIRGVEFARELHAICEENLRRLGDGRITCQLGDAADFEYPVGDLVVYMNNPFDSPLVESCMARLVESVRANPRQVRLVYMNPRPTSAFDHPPWRTVIADAAIAVHAIDLAVAA